jgi:hypothetical protein
MVAYSFVAEEEDPGPADGLARLHPRPVRTFDRVRNITSAAHIRRRGRPRIARFNGVILRSAALSAKSRNPDFEWRSDA